MTDSISRWRDGDSGAFSNEIDHPPGRACDNHALFTAEALALGIIDKYEFIGIVTKFEAVDGLLLRYPRASDFCSWDDHLGCAAVDHWMAERVLHFFGRSRWRTPTGDRLWRFPIFIPTVKASAGHDINLVLQLLACAAFLWNLLEPKEETSGKILLWLAQRPLERFWLCRQAIKLWRWSMARKYESPRELFHIYFPDKAGQEHPFVTFAPREWK